jgi:hypothetical protein
MNVSIARYVLGLVCLGLTLGSVWAGAMALRRRWLADWAGAPATLADFVIAFALLIGVLEVLGAVGLFKLVPIVIGCVVSGAVAWRASGALPGRRAQRVPARGVLGAAIAVAFTATLAAEYASPSLQAYDLGVHVLDSIWYHLPLAAAFAQSGHVTPLRPDIEFLTAFYPASDEMLHALGIVTLGRDTLTPALNLLLLGPVMLATWCVGRRWDAGAAAVGGVTVALATPMMVFSQAGSADNDLLGVFFFLAAVALLLHSEDRPAVFVLAGLAAGLSISVRLTLLAPALALTAGVLVLAPPGRRRASAVRWLVPLVLAGGFWFVRNLIAVGNPTPWAGLGVLPTPAPPLQAKVGFTIAHYLGDGRIWSHFWEPALASGLGSWWYLIVGGALAGGVLCAATGPGRTIRMLGVVALVSLGAYLITPESAMGPPGDPVGIAYNLRYCAPGLTLGLALLPVARPFAGPRRQLALLAGLIAVLIATVTEPRLWPDRHAGGAAIVGVAVAALALLWHLRHAAFRARALPLRAAAVAAAASLLLAAAAGGYVWQRHYMRGRYAFRPGVSRLAGVWALFRGIHHQRVGLVGTFGAFFSYPLFGIDDSNDVVYIAHHGPHGSFTPIRDCRSWRQTVNAERPDFLVTTPARDPFRPKVLTASPEAGWTASDPAAHLVFQRRALGQRIVVFKLSGRLNPGSCA